MSVVSKGLKGERVLLMGNDAIARGALEAGVKVVAGYPGTPSSEIVQTLAEAAGDHGLYVEWSANEKVALEVAAAGSYAGLRSMAVMKQVGVNVASDFLLHLAEYGTRGGMVLVSCEDPGALSSTNEGDSRPYAKMMEFPLVEPGDFQEAKDMAKWCFELSEEIRNVVMLRSVTRMSHASGNLTLGEIKPSPGEADFKYDGEFMDQMNGPALTFPGLVDPMRKRQLDKLERAREIFETCPYNTYTGPKQPELLIISSSAAYMYSREAIRMLGLEKEVGLLKLGTTWPLPPQLLAKRHLATRAKVMVVEEGTPFLEDNVKALAAELGPGGGHKGILRPQDGTLPPTNELNPDLVAAGAGQDPGAARRFPAAPKRICRDRRPAGRRERPGQGAHLLPRLPPPGLLLADQPGPETGQPPRLCVRRHRLLHHGGQALRIQHAEDHPRHGLGHRHGQRFRQAESIRHGPAGAGHLRRLHLFPRGAARPGERGAQPGGHDPGGGGQLRHRHDRIPAPPRHPPGRGRGAAAHGGHRHGVRGHGRPGGDRRSL
jgi:TPP-dependent indolepyruvate ferredoxin oxidoreductase alpha subunit